MDFIRKGISKNIVQNLPISQQNEIELSSDLLQVKIYLTLEMAIKNYLITKIKKRFEIEPSSKETHQHHWLKFPRLKPYNTNYDTL
jgi:hypothetical protein